mmetsp:Transcript_13580/g.29531  ORF Transcript_13580/g.29531 Transcript_13580/m.29531 type:complete len:376 (+) Transcript_13580:221-1348(+)|eukprot:CAMPEP_0172323430 /NCGR_PEP_ID=MMETSP1058-20130122/48723_1 /TAXON_ID=83371 /ORGANISM="Detonula confervacea, Strain CCMP 353" /LENGTH=375 /DNA_ID=CAMNT_0013039423 /DNA_START=141 /DNA_END=1268 /DNA_ORIENTATION=+
MALAFRVSHPDDFARMFAAYDEYSSIINDLFGRVLTPDDDFYTAPWCFMPDGDCGGFVVFTAQVPWLHGHGHVLGTHRDTQNSREQHFQRASRRMRDCAVCHPEDIPCVEMGPEKMQLLMELDDDDIFTFTKDGCYPGKDDISQALEDIAVKVTCEAMGWEMPPDWRQERERQSRMRCVEEVFDLVEHDAKKTNGTGGNKRKRCTIIDPYAALNSRQGGEQEEMKGCFHDSHDVEHGRDEQQMNHSIEPYSTLISRESGEHEEKKDAFHESHDMEHGSDEQQMNHPIDPYGTSISRERGEHEEKMDSFHEHSHVGYERFQQQHVDTFYDEDSNVIDENENHRHSRVGYENVEQQQNGDTFYDGIDENKDGRVVEI